ncbi:GAF domain-containing protein [Nonlabens dokdonensis]|jgi:signal transduction histidine kinase|uniref:histidine kinase n=2 Tax=Nonlabens dokdonensis TaxID=328515 RepID=L7WE32_NONDD|nr:GAF domain-containing sensor histidine kinase [Nonlabens dokdonensis]AGC78339.1 sensor protein [Nonlabens dokdonensis DSW-6]PZX37776.1 GAF domain-containing protein [Nonlabens dokdonensis]
MIAPPTPDNETKRQAAVEKYKLLDTMPEENYDNITSIISSICNAPISLITLIDKDRNFLKSRHGIDMSESPRELSFCGHAIAGEEEIMIVKDARKDVRFKGNPLVTDFKAIFYAGVPLVDSNGYKLGTLCVYDHEPRELDQHQIKSLKAMAKQVMSLFEERYKTFELEKLQIKLQDRNNELKDFAGIVSHDLKAPLSNIIMITQLLNDGDEKLSKQAKEYLGYLKESSTSMSRYIDGMLMFYRSDELVTDEYDSVSYVDLIEDVISMTVLDDSTKIHYIPENDTTLLTNEIALKQILINLVTNAVKYGDKEQTIIDITLKDHLHEYEIIIKDNGRGIPTDKIDSVFKLFFVAAEEDRHGKQGTGIGLATVSRLLEHMDGTISVSSEVGKWTEFIIHLPKREI